MGDNIAASVIAGLAVGVAFVVAFSFVSSLPQYHHYDKRTDVIQVPEPGNADGMGEILVSKSYFFSQPPIIVIVDGERWQPDPAISSSLSLDGRVLGQQEWITVRQGQTIPLKIKLTSNDDRNLHLWISVYNPDDMSASALAYARVHFANPSTEAESSAIPKGIVPSFYKDDIILKAHSAEEMRLDLVVGHDAPLGQHKIEVLVFATTDNDEVDVGTGIAQTLVLNITN